MNAIRTHASDTRPARARRTATVVVAMALAVLCGLALPGCASRPDGAVHARSEPGTASNAQRYRQAVNANAERNNVLVQWVNPPDDEDLRNWAETRAEDRDEDR